MRALSMLRATYNKVEIYNLSNKMSTRFSGVLMFLEINGKK